MLLVTSCIVAVVAFMLLSLRFGVWPAISIAILSTAILLPRRLTNNSVIENTGLAGSAPEIYTYTTVLFFGAIILVATKSWPIPRFFAPLAVVLVTGCLISWGQNSLVMAGLLQISLGLIAWAVGARVGSLMSPGTQFERLLCTAILVIILVEAVVCLAQLAGIPINPLNPSTAALMGDRVNGTMNHPNNLGKVLLFLIALLTPLTRSADRQIQRRAVTGTVIAFLPLALTGGRATFLAALLIVLMTALLSKGVKGRFMMPVGAFLLILPFIDAMWQRFEDDPEGGSRAYLTGVALQQISQNPWSGVGPNSYVSVVGLTDALTATGLPVHNAFLLATTELGLPGAVALFLPIVVVLTIAWRRRMSAGYAGSSARAYVAFVPAWILVAATGWGMMSGSLLVMWFFTLGFLAQPFLATKTDNEHKHTQQHFSLLSPANGERHLSNSELSPTIKQEKSSAH